MHSRMNDLQVNLNFVVALVCYVFGLALILIACVGVIPDPFADLGMALFAVGALRTIASWMLALERREQNAFEIGRDFEAGRVRKLP